MNFNNLFALKWRHLCMRINLKERKKFLENLGFLKARQKATRAPDSPKVKTASQVLASHN